jgi:hypothetical protein
LNFTIEKTSAYERNYVAKVTPTASSSTTIYTESLYPCKPGQVGEVSAYMKADSNISASYLGISWYTEKDTLLSTSWSSNYGGNYSWAARTFRAIAPTGAVKYKPNIKFTSGLSQGTGRVDSVQVPILVSPALDTNMYTQMDIAAQSIGNIAVDIAAQTLGTVSVDLSANSLGNLTIDINAQSIGNLATNIYGDQTLVAAQSPTGELKQEVTTLSAESIEFINVSQTATLVAGDSEEILISPPSNYIYELISMYIKCGSVTATSGSTYFYLQLKSGVNPVIRITYARAPYTDPIIEWDNFQYIDYAGYSAYYPEDLTAQCNCIKGIRWDSTDLLRILHINFTNADETTQRTYVFQVRKIKVA